MRQGQGVPTLTLKRYKQTNFVICVNYGTQALCYQFMTIYSGKLENEDHVARIRV